VACALSHFAELAPRRGDHHTADQRRGRRADRPGRRVRTAITFVVEDGRITRMYAMRNPHELGRLDAVAELRR
jgi:RNA polymerase sigma-70 factor (ECF subfamily)